MSKYDKVLLSILGIFTSVLLILIIALTPFEEQRTNVPCYQLTIIGVVCEETKNMDSSWKLLDGHDEYISQQPKLYDLIGTQFGSGNIYTFKVPDLTPRFSCPTCRRYRTKGE